MKENTCNYSDEWQNYIGDYDKFEYDIELKDGTIVENCYSNGGNFHSISEEHDGQSFNEDLVNKIRFSQKPKYGINYGVSKADQDKYLDEAMSKNRDKIEAYERFAGMANDFSLINPYINYHGCTLPNLKPSRGKIVPVRTEPKIGRNEPCPCNSGKKFKKCCINEIK